jgi:hypothetical protein
MSNVGIENIDRSIFGFLCFDHRIIDYFDEADAFVAKVGKISQPHDRLV